MEDVYSRSTPQCTYYYQPNATLLCTIIIIHAKAGIYFPSHFKLNLPIQIWYGSRDELRWSGSMVLWWPLYRPVNERTAS